MPTSAPVPQLRAGWEPDTPVDDSLLRQFLVNWTASIEAHSLPMGGRALRRDDLAAADLGRPSFGGNVVTLLAPLLPEAVETTAAVLDDFYGFACGDGTGTVFLFSPWPTPDLRAHGWTLLAYQPLMLRMPGGAAPPDPPRLRIEPVIDAATLRAFEIAMVRGFESSELEAARPGSVFGPPILGDGRLRTWVGWEEDRPVSAAAAFVDAGITNVTLVGTVPEARRRGYGAALTWRATLADPALPAMLLATDEGRPVYERMGYVSLFRFAVWSRERPVTTR
jgi:hypothetical protein